MELTEEMFSEHVSAFTESSITSVVEHTFTQQLSQLYTSWDKFRYLFHHFALHQYFMSR